MQGQALCAMREYAVWLAEFLGIVICGIGNIEV